MKCDLLFIVSRERARRNHQTVARVCLALPCDPHCVCVCVWLCFRSIVFYSKEVDSWCVPFFGCDKTVIYRTQKYNYEKNQEQPVSESNSVFVNKYPCYLDNSLHAHFPPSRFTLNWYDLHETWSMFCRLLLP